MPKPKVQKRKNDMSECTNGKTLPDTFWAPAFKYEETIHPNMLIDTARNGGWKSDFCVQAEICGNTFDEWTRKYPKFATAWNRAKEIVRAQMEYKLSLPSETSLAQIQYLYNVRFKPNAVKIKGISKAKTSMDAVKCVAETIMDGELESTQLNSAIKFVEVKVIVEESAKQDARISKLEQDHGVTSRTEQET